jgi:hypothetical protein
MMLPNDGMSGPNGIRKLVSFYRKQFRIPENLNHYSKEDLSTAERKFIKFALQGGHNLIPMKSNMDH